MSARPKDTGLVAQRGYDDIGPPQADGRVVRPDHPYGRAKVKLWHDYASAAATAMRGKPSMPWRVCVDMYASCGVNQVGGELRWGSALLALQVAYPFDMYVFCEEKPKLASALAERIADRDQFGYDPLLLDLGSKTLGSDIAAINDAHAEVKIVVVTGDPNEAAKYVRHLLPAWEGRRYVLTLIDPNGANFRWDALDMLTARESMDVMFLFPEDMDIERNARMDAQMPVGEARLDRYYPDGRWRSILLDPNVRDLGLGLRNHYKRDMERLLGYRHFGRDFRVRNSGGGQIYTLCFASKREFGKTLWDRVHKHDPDNQLLFPI